MASPDERPLGRRAELTFSANRTRGRHGWLRLTPAYSVDVVDALLRDAPRSARVLDPFSGTATTTLCAAERGLDAVSLDINPFLVWLGRTKLRRFAKRTLQSVARSVPEILAAARTVSPNPPPPIHRIERWWPEATLDWLCRLDAVLPARGAASALLRVAFCRTMIDVSGAAFDHPSMSFGETRDHDDEALEARFLADCAHVLEAASVPLPGRGEVKRGDARTLDALGDARFDRVITSPPYPNRMSYVRELRPYMYWTRHLKVARDAGELDWKAIGGTWGIATSRLNEWEPTAAPDALLKPILRNIRAAPKNGPLLATYVERYFEDTASHLRAVRKRVSKNGEVHYVVGNSTFYGVLLPVEELYARLLEQAGFRDAEVHVLRKRNSKKELYEFRVSARS